MPSIDRDNEIIVQEMCRACADDLARWMRAFDTQHEPLLATLLEGLRDHIVKRGQGVPLIERIR